jgi:tetratricopeptide (TPR) repeat protein
MKTLYELLGALPDDDAEELRAAFRKAVKGAHPDINPGDPHAAVRFRQIMRANEILSDGQQRAAYDHLLDVARHEQDQDSKRAVAAKVHKIASGVMAIAGASAATIGGYMLFMHMSAASVAPLRPAVVAIDRIKLNPASARLGELAAAAQATTSDVVAAAAEVSPTAPVETAANLPPETPTLASDRAEDSHGSDEDNKPCAVTHPAKGCTPDVTAALPTAVAPPSGPVVNDARFYHDRGMASYRKGDMLAAIADLDQAIQIDPKYSGAFYDRGIVFYRMRKFDRAFADVSRAQRIEKSNRAMLDAMARKQQVRPLKLEPPKVTRVSQRHTTGVPD